MSETCEVTPDVSGVSVEVGYEALSDSLVRIDSREELKRLLNAHPVIRDLFLNRGDYPNDSIYIDSWYRRYSNAYIDTLLEETRNIFGREEELRASFTGAFRNMKYYYPTFQPPKITTLISGLENDLIVTDTLIVVGLDSYLGPGAKYRPRVYHYLLDQYEPEMIVPSCVLIYGIDAQFNKNNPDDHTVLADMIAYGKSFVFARHMLPCVADSTLLWYTSAEMEAARNHEDLIWRTMIGNEILYSSSHLVKQRYLEARPNTYEVSPSCPGRIGQWVGWQIVKAYMARHPEITLQQLMDETDASKVFKESGYHP